jgi:hypothetical protein
VFNKFYSFLADNFPNFNKTINPKLNPPLWHASKDFGRMGVGIAEYYFFNLALSYRMK